MTIDKRMNWQVETLWTRLPEEVRLWAVPIGDETAHQRAARVERWEQWLRNQEWAHPILRAALVRSAQQRANRRAEQAAEREACRAACRAAGLTAPMARARRAHLRDIWRRTGVIQV